MYEVRSQSSIFSLSKRTSKPRATTMKFEADISLRKKNGASPHTLACQNGHGSTVQLLQNNGAYIYLLKDIQAG